jgi:photosystem II stability/assembly factor-like uncharacterized protein
MISALRRAGLKLGLLALLYPAVYVSSDELASVIDLRGIPGPYSFNRFSRLRSGEFWSVGGDGRVVFESATDEYEQHPTLAALSGVYFINSSCGWVVGTAGTILHTTDGGKNWIAQNSGVKDDLEGITCVDENRCWIVGHNGVALRTDNAGEDWEKVDVGLSDNFYAVDFINSQTGWAVGEGGVVVNTYDGGQTWNVHKASIILFPKSEFVGPGRLLSVKFTNEYLGWVAGSGGIARTTDGGKTWQTKLKRISFEGIGLVCHDGKRVWAINKAGKNYYSQDAGETWKPYPKQPTNAHRDRRER